MISIPPATLVWDNQNKDDFEKSVQSVITAIARASEQGLRKTNFNPINHQHYEAVKREFQQHGYYFTPTGYIGGILQRTENINW